MKIAIISDIHENFHNLVRFFERVENENIEKILFLGDGMNAGISGFLAQQKIAPVYAIWGNNDGEIIESLKKSWNSNGNLEYGYATYDFLEIDKRKIFITHYPNLANPMARSGKFDVVFYGHDHKKDMYEVDNCLIVNPGEISSNKTGNASFAIYDTKTNTAEIIDLKNIVTLKTNIVEEYRKRIGFKYTVSKSHQK